MDISMVTTVFGRRMLTGRAPAMYHSFCGFQAGHVAIHSWNGWPSTPRCARLLIFRFQNTEKALHHSKWPESKR